MENWEKTTSGKQDTQCLECKAYHGHHAPSCSSMDGDYARKELIRYHKAWENMELEIRKRESLAKIRINKSKDQSEFWRGKFLVVKNENNMLRKQLKKQNDKLD